MLSFRQHDFHTFDVKLLYKMVSLVDLYDYSCTVLLLLAEL